MKPKTKKILKKSALYSLAVLPIVTMLGSFAMFCVCETKSDNQREKYEAKQSIIREFALTDEFKDRQKTDKENIELAHQLGVISDKDYKEKILNLTSLDYAIDVANEKEDFKTDIAQMKEHHKKSLAWGGTSFICLTTCAASAVATVRKSKDLSNKAKNLQ